MIEENDNLSSFGFVFRTNVFRHSWTKFFLLLQFEF